MSDEVIWIWNSILKLPVHENIKITFVEMRAAFSVL